MMNTNVFSRRIAVTCSCILIAFAVPLFASRAIAGETENKKPAEILLAEAGKSVYRIVVADDASESTMHGARELQTFLKQITDADFPVVSDNTSLKPHEIIIGNNSHLAQIGVKIDFEKLGDEGYVIKTSGNRLVIAGGSLRGNLYGVYGLLEDHLGCRWFTSEVSRIPKRRKLTLPEIDETRIPVFEYRYPFVTECFDPDWSAHNRMNGSKKLTKKHGGYVKRWHDIFGHSFQFFLPPAKYFDKHPEYFALVKGKRLKDHSQPCCTNEDVIKIIKEGVLKALRTDPACSIVHVSQNDNFNQCRCDKCKALSAKEGSDMAPVLKLVNAVAEAVEKEFPKISVMTFAYQWTRKPPKTIRPRKNVIIQLCSIECCFAHPLAECNDERNRAFVKDLEAWSKICNRLWIWDYNTSFTHYLVPFPNQRVRDDNIRLFQKNNVKGVFEQDCYNTRGGELAELGGYITARHLWNPDYGEDRAMNEFLEGVYGKAAPFIRKYIDMLHDRSEKENIHNNIWIGFDYRHLTEKLLAEADRLFEKAEAAVADGPGVLKRVKIARMSVDYAILERARFGISRNYKIDHENFRIIPDPVCVRRIGPFFEAIRLSGLTRLREWNRADFKKYREGFKHVVTERKLTPMEPVDSKDLAPGLAYEYYEGNWRKLPDFAKLTPLKSGIANSFDIGITKKKQNFAVKFTGFIEVPADGIYTFITTSSAGNKLYIGNQLVVDNDGFHHAAERVGLAALKAGKHPVTVTYYAGTMDGMLDVSYKGPGLKKQKIPSKALFHKK
ncbi:MAG: DUF4838 domain-containing protein [Planctomycetota bacterium]|nr:MAG: DUF4838 domain-containing protein [Planctomycetota bacterium]